MDMGLLSGDVPYDVTFERFVWRCAMYLKRRHPDWGGGFIRCYSGVHVNYARTEFGVCRVWSTAPD